MPNRKAPFRGFRFGTVDTLVYLLFVVFIVGSASFPDRPASNENKPLTLYQAFRVA